MSNAWIPVFIFEILALSTIVVLILKIYISFRRTPIYASFSAWFGWLLCFGIVFMVPIDIIATDHNLCMKAHNMTEETEHSSVCNEPPTYLPQSVMTVEWGVLYWGTFILSWVGYPILQTYSLTGEFTLWERVVSAVKANVILYMIMAIAGIVGLIAILIASGGLSSSDLITLIMTVANIYGLLLIIILMGYGLVDIPRYLLRKASRTRTMRHYMKEVALRKEQMEQSKLQLTKTLKKIRNLDDKIREDDPYRPYIDIIVSKVPVEYDSITNGEGDVELTYSKLTCLHTELLADTHNAMRSVCLYEQLVKKALELEDVMKTKTLPPGKVHWSFKKPRTHRLAKLHDQLEWLWEVWLHVWAYNVLGVCCVLLTVCIVWSELTLVAPIQLSPFYYLIDLLGMQGFGKQLYCFTILCYMTACCYTTLFKIRIFNYYRLVPHQMSDANSIMFSANYLCRLAIPLAYNFLEFMVSTPEDTKNFTFYTVMGSMDAFVKVEDQSKGAIMVNNVTAKFRIVFPILVAILCLLTLFNFWRWLGSCCCIKSLRSESSDVNRLIDDGADILKSEREQKEGIPLQEKKSIKSFVKSMFSKNPDGASMAPSVKHKPKAASSTSSSSSANSNSNGSAILNTPSEPKWQYKPGSIAAMYTAEGKISTKGLKFKKMDEIELLPRKGPRSDDIV